MTNADYRALIEGSRANASKIKVLGDVLVRERAAYDVLAGQVDKLKASIEEERQEYMKTIMALEQSEERYRQAQYWPGLIFGAGTGTEGGRQAIIGLGWRITLPVRR
jgi:hypothetical protein